MPSALQQELRQRRPFQSAGHEAVVGLMRTADLIRRQAAALIEPHGITLQQFNVLRILRGAEPDGLCRNELRDRMLTRMPDVTRLLDRMEESGLVTRTRDADDRRLVSTRITRQGRRMLDDLDGAVSAHQKQRLGHLDKEQLRTLSDLLTLVRQPR